MLGVIWVGLVSVQLDSNLTNQIKHFLFLPGPPYDTNSTEFSMMTNSSFLSLTRQSLTKEELNIKETVIVKADERNIALLDFFKNFHFEFKKYFCTSLEINKNYLGAKSKYFSHLAERPLSHLSLISYWDQFGQSSVEIHSCRNKVHLILITL